MPPPRTSPVPRPAPGGHTPRTLALGYLALMAAAGLVRGFAGASGDGWLAALYFLSFPGSLLVTVLVMVLDTFLDGSGPETAHPFGPMVYLVGGAAVNVLLLWGAAKAVRRTRR